MKLEMEFNTSSENLISGSNLISGINSTFQINSVVIEIVLNA